MPTSKAPAEPISGEVIFEQEVAEATGIARGTLRYWRATGDGPRWFRLGARRVGYLRRDVETWLVRQYDNPLRDEQGARIRRA